jgi:hypothetical protein
MFPQKVDEYSLYKSDKPVLDRNDVPRRDDTVTRAKIPMCAEHNGILNKRFGQPAKPIIRNLLDSEGELVLDAAEAEIAAVWYVKTGLLLGHPKVVWTQPGWDVRFTQRPAEVGVVFVQAAPRRVVPPIPGRRARGAGRCRRRATGSSPPSRASAWLSAAARPSRATSQRGWRPPGSRTGG